MDGVAAATVDVVATVDMKDMAAGAATVIAEPTRVAAVRAAAMQDALPTAAAEMDTAAVVMA